MKKTKKLAAVLLALVMLVAFAIPAFAQTETYSITISPTTTNHTYNVYQIFSGDISGTDNNITGTSGYKLANIQWGSSISDPAAFLEALKTKNNTKYGGCTTAGDVAKALISATDLDEFLGVLNTGTYLGTAAATQKANGTSVTINLTEAGYYLVKDSLSGDGTNEFVSDYIVQVLGEETMTPKGDVAEIKKEVKDTNDSTDAAGTYTEWQKSADHDIGDDVPFLISATVSDDYANYDEYTFIIHDKECNGLTFKSETVEVKVDGTKIETGYQVVTDNLNDGCTFHVVFENLKDIGSVHAGSVITVEYKSTLNANAVVGPTGNPNEVYLEYSNNPNAAGTGKTTKDYVIVFTYQVDVNKVDGNSTPLPGAAFKLEKKLQSGGWTDVDEITTDGTTTFSFEGIDDGTYRLTETKTPTGYNTIDPIEFTVTGGHIAADGKTTAYAAPTVTDAVDLGFATTQDNGGVETTVVNESGTTLPETGGMGTTIFYVLGGLLVVGAGVLLIVRFRMRATNNE